MALVLFYSRYSDYTAEFFIREFAEAVATGEEITVRFNSPGGDPLAGYGMLRSIREAANEPTLKVDGMAASMMAYALCFTNSAQALTQSQFLLHRASSYMEDFDEAARAMVVNINEDLRAALEAKIDVAEFERLAGFTVERMFDMEQPVVEWVFDAEQAEAIGLIDSRYNLMTGEIETLQAGANAWNKSLVAAQSDGEFLNLKKIIEGDSTKKPLAKKPIVKTPIKPEAEKPESQKQTRKMKTIQEIQAAHPDLYKEIYELGQSEERDRVNAFLAFADHDLPAVLKGIEEGKKLSQADMAKFFKASMAKAQEVEELEEESPEETDEPGGKKPEAGGEKKPEAGGKKKPEASKKPVVKAAKKDEGGEEEEDPELESFEANLKKRLKIKAEA